jgi:hypothetical protein
MAQRTFKSILIASAATLAVVLLPSCTASEGEQPPKSETSSTSQPPTETTASTPTQIAGVNLTFSVESTVDPATVSGFVVGASSSYEVVPLTGQTDDQGRQLYGIANVPPGKHDIIITGRSTSASGENNLGIRLDDVLVGSSTKRLGQVELPVMGRLIGKVVLAGTSNSLREGTLIAIEGADEHYFTSSVTNGTFIMPRVPVGTHKVFVSRQGYQRLDKDEIEIAAATDTDLGELLLFPSGGASGQIKINGGAAVTGSLTVTVSIVASPNATVFMISEDPNFTNQTFLPLQASKSFTFSAAPGENSSTLTLWAQFANNDDGLETTTSTTIRYDDSLPPTPTISQVNPSVSNLTVVPMRVDFSEAVSGFAAADLVVRNSSDVVLTGVVSDFAADPEGGYTFSVSTAADFSVSIAAGAASDLDGNTSVAAAAGNIVVDTISPAPVITLATADGLTALDSVTNETSWKATITFSEAVQSFGSSDLTVVGASVSSFVASSATVFTALLTPTAETVTIDIAAEAARDLNGNSSAAAVQKSQKFGDMSSVSNLSLVAGCVASTGCEVIGLALSGNTLFAGTSNLGATDFHIKSISVSNKASPSVVGTLTGLSARVVNLALVGGQLALTTGDAFRVYGISDPTSLSLRDSGGASMGFFSAISAGNYVYAARYSAPRGILPIGLADPDNISEASVVSAGVLPTCVATTTAGLFVWDASGESLRSFSLGTPSAPAAAGTLALASVEGIKASGNYLHVARSVSPQYQVFDVSSLGAMTLVGGTDLDANGARVAIQGNYAYVLSTTSLSVFSSFSQSTPTLKGRISVADGTSIVVDGEYVYVGTLIGRVVIIRHTFGSP